MLERSTVLIADDEDICLSITEKMAENLSFSVICARDGEEAIRYFQQNRERICCIILDIHMPKINGIEAFHRIREMGSDVPVIIASGFLNKSNQKQLEPLHPLGYLEKPISFESLADLLQKCKS